MKNYKDMTQEEFEALPVKKKAAWAKQHYRDMSKEEFRSLSLDEKESAVRVLSMSDAEIAQMEWDVRHAEERAEQFDRVMIEQIV